MICLEAMKFGAVFRIVIEHVYIMYREASLCLGTQEDWKLVCLKNMVVFVQEMLMGL